MPSTRTTVIGVLLVVGIGSFAYQICSDDEVTLGGTLVMLGTECLKTAVFFILLDNLIAKSEKRSTEFEQAKEALLVGSWSTSEEVNRLLDKVTRSEQVSVPFGRAANFRGVSLELVGRKFNDTEWCSSDFESASLDGCSFESIRLVSISFSKCVFSDCQFDDCKFQNVDLTGAVFIRCTFRELKADTIIGEATFTDCTGHEPLHIKRQGQDGSD